MNPPATATPLGELAATVRSKNAGPFWTTVDLFFPDDRAYRRAAREGVITAEIIAAIYRIDPAGVRIFRLPALHAVKISYPRPVPQGSVADSDIHSGQQYIPLLRLPIP